MAREDVSGAALATAGPTAVTQTCSTSASALNFFFLNSFFKMTFRTAKHLYLYSNHTSITSARSIEFPFKMTRYTQSIIEGKILWVKC